MPRTQQRTTHRRPQRWRVQHADCLTALPRLTAESIDAVISDPPYGIGISNLDWDGAAIRNATRQSAASTSRPEAFQEFTRAWAAECMQAMRPGAHMLIFGAPRTFHRLVTGIEDAGLEIRDVLLWIHGQGFPKSENLTGHGHGWGTALKPAYESILLARRPMKGSTAENHARHRTGALHIDACRIQERRACEARHRRAAGNIASHTGRWPANLTLSHDSACNHQGCRPGCPIGMLGERHRFFYAAKASQVEREAGCSSLPLQERQTFKIGEHGRQRARARPVANIHPTVKPLSLMRWLVRLITPPGGLVLDPFTGSGSTGAAALLEGARFHGIERDAAYLPIARARIRHWANQAPKRRGGCR